MTTLAFSPQLPLSRRVRLATTAATCLAVLLLIWVALVQRRARLAIAAGLIKLERFSRAFGLVQGMMRDRDGRITYWDGGAERLYGYSSEEALGRVSHELLRAEFPRPREEINAELAREGRWRGELAHHRKDGTELAVASSGRCTGAGRARRPS